MATGRALPFSLSFPRAGSRSRAGAVAAAAEAVAAEAARGGGPGGGVVGVGMDRARRRQLQEPALETEPRRWRRRRLSVVSPPVSDWPRPWVGTGGLSSAARCGDRASSRPGAARTFGCSGVAEAPGLRLDPASPGFLPVIGTTPSSAPARALSRLPFGPS